MIGFVPLTTAQGTALVKFYSSPKCNKQNKKLLFISETKVLAFCKTIKICCVVIRQEKSAVFIRQNVGTFFSSKKELGFMLHQGFINLEYTWILNSTFTHLIGLIDLLFLIFDLI
jgi:hypothetical protein